MKPYIISRWYKNRMPDGHYAVNGPDGQTIGQVTRMDAGGWHAEVYPSDRCPARSWYDQTFATREDAAEAVYEYACA